VQKWKDKRDVLTIFTKHRASFKEVRCKSGKVVNKPSTVADYNENMSGIDRADQMISYYYSPRKSIRWYIKLFFSFIRHYNLEFMLDIQQSSFNQNELLGL